MAPEIADPLFLGSDEVKHKSEEKDRFNYPTLLSR